MLTWLLPFLAIGMGDQLVLPNLASGRTLAAAWLAGGVAGTAWQLLYRRDLVDRLTYFAAAIVVWIVLGAVTDAHLSLWGSVGSEFAALGVLVALIYTEQWHRWRQHRHAVETGTHVTQPVTQ